MAEGPLIFFDTETYPIRPGRQAPRVVCVQVSPGRLLLREEGLDLIEDALAQGETLCGHSVGFDVLACIASRPRLLEPFFWAYAEDRIVCTQVREMLIRIAQGRLKSSDTSLLGALKAHKIPSPFADGVKESEVRTSYARLDGIPVAQWPDEYRAYALADLVVQDVYQAQQEYAVRGWLEDQYRQTRADFVLRLTSAWGMMPDQEAVDAFSARVDTEHEEIKKFLQTAGLVRPNGTKNTKKAAARMRAICRSKGLPIPITDTGLKKLEEIGRAQAEEQYTALTADDCLSVSDDTLIRYARFGSVKTLQSRAARLRAAGSLPIQTRFNVLVESGRTSCRAGKTKPGKSPTAFGDQVQNPHREAGVRECYRARPGFVLSSVDWSSAELHTLAQVCVNMGLESELARVLRSGLDAHLNFACHMNSWDYDWAKANKKDPRVKAARQGAKAANFGFPGGLGATKFRLYAAKTYGVELSEQEAKDLKAWWFRLYPEMRAYFVHINEIGEGPLVQHSSGRYRGRVTYCGAANSYFQGLAADMAKHAGFALAWECYLGKVPGTEVASPLGGSRPWNFVHDEWILEVPEDRAHEAAMRQVQVMEEAGRIWCPDVPVRAEPALSRVWRKSAEAVYASGGRLIPYEDRAWAPGEREKIQEALDRGQNPIYVEWEHGRILR